MMIHRLAVFVGALSLLTPAFSVWAVIVSIPAVGLVSVVSFAAILVVLVGVAVARSERTLARLDYAVLMLGLGLLIAMAVAQVYRNPGYGSDEAAFIQAAASMVLHGHNPYGANLLSALSTYRVPAAYATYTMNGGVVSTLGWPDLSVLVVAAFVWLTHGVQSVPVAYIVALAAAMVIGFFVLPRRLRALAVLGTIGLPIMFDFAAGGNNTLLLIPFLMVTAWRWTDIGKGGVLSRTDWARAICFGLACSVQQLPWFTAPFLVVAVWRLRSRDRGRRQATAVTARFATVAAGTFLAMNAPFIALGPGKWLSAVLGPLVQQAVPFGQGLVDTAIYFHIGSGDLSAFSDGALLLYVAFLVAFAIWFSRLGRAVFILPVAILFFPTRSLVTYFTILLTVWMVSLLTIEHEGFTGVFPPMFGRGGRRAAMFTLAVLMFGAGGMLGIGLGTPAPLQMAITSVQTNGEFGSVWRMAVRVTNETGSRLRPHFAPNFGGYMTTYWYMTSGPPVLAPHATGDYMLTAPNVTSMPGITTPFLLEAVTPEPQTISSTQRFTFEHFVTYITPPSFNKELALGASATLYVELRNVFGASVAKGGVPIALGQVIYGKDSLIPGEVQINGGTVGQSPVVARTDAAGVATFVVHERLFQDNPIYFQAWTPLQDAYPAGYSEIVSVYWRRR
jgi:uncharacterized membrane protein